MGKRITTFAESPLHLKDIRDIPFESLRVFEQVLLDEESTCKLFIITELLKRLAPMYNDDNRLVWIEVLRGAPSEWCSFKKARDDFDIETREDYLREWKFNHPDEVEWFYVMSVYYRDMHYLFSGDGRCRKCSFANRSSVKEENDGYRYDFSELLDRLGKYLRSVIQKIEEDPVGYYRYISDHLPYNRRRGTISMKDYRDILGISPWKGTPKTVGAFLRRHADDVDRDPPVLEGVMTIRRYALLWSICYRATRSIRHGREEDALDTFSRANSKGAEIKGFNPDNEDDFIKWFEENSSYHCFDVVYARVHLVPHKSDDGWRLYLYGELEGFKKDIIAAGMALEKACVPFSMHDVAAHLLKDYNSEGEILFSPLGGWRSDIERPSRDFPYEGEDGVTEEMLERLATATRWIPLKKAIPMEKIIQEGLD